MDKFLVTVGGILLIGFIYWFFFGKKDSYSEVDDEKTLEIIVSGGYKPDKIKVKQGKAVDITFIRTDDNSCLEEVVFPDFRIKEYLPLNKPVTVHLVPTKVGIFPFHCSMNMFHGQLIVTNEN